MKFIVLDKHDNDIVNCLEENCKNCIAECSNQASRVTCPKSKEQRRFGITENKSNKIFLCTPITLTKTAKLFSEKIKMLAYSIPAITEIKETALAEAAHIEKEKYSKIVHNLKTLNAQSIQVQYKFIPQNVYSDNHDKLFDFLKTEIKARPHEATIALLRLSKNNAHMKTEFSTHEKLSVENPNLLIQEHNIRSVMLNVYHSFDIDFRESKVIFQIFDSIVYLRFDYDTIRVALYHIFSNTIKYVSPSSKVRVKIYEEEESTHVDFEMRSLHIPKREREKIFIDYYSGESTKIKQKNGSGLGMGLIKKALSINEAELKVICGDRIHKSNGQEFSDNIFRITFNTTPH